MAATQITGTYKPSQITCASNTLVYEVQLPPGTRSITLRFATNAGRILYEDCGLRDGEALGAHTDYEDIPADQIVSLDVVGQHFILLNSATNATTCKVTARRGGS